MPLRRLVNDHAHEAGRSRSKCEAFYVAFRDKDLDAMDAIWAKKTKVSVIHPGWNTLVGRDEVMSSWHRIIKLRRRP